MENEEIKIFCANVLAIRKKHALAKETMAILLGIGVGSLNKIEKGILPPRLCCDVLIRLRDVFGLSIADIFKKNLFSCEKIKGEDTIKR